MNNNDFSVPTASPSAPSPLLLAMPVSNEEQFNYYFMIKIRSFWCYKQYLTLEINKEYYVIKYKNGVLEIPRIKNKDYVIDILKTIGIKNKHIFKVYVMNGQIVLSKRRLYDLNSIINFVNKTEMIMENVKHT
tara:strand:+ start:586 stop:984 length:399 start_codon:yes stop_codon:yes gene_type:complete